MAERLLYSQVEAAVMLGVSRLTLISEIEAGRLRYVLVGKRRKFKVSDIAAIIDRERRALEGNAPIDYYGEEFGPPAPPPPLVLNARAILIRTRSGAKSRLKPFDLTEASVAAMIARAAGCCEVSGIPFSNISVGDTSPFAPSIDRIDALKGYAEENCRLVCYAVNVALHVWGDAVLRRIAHAIVEKDDGRN